MEVCLATDPLWFSYFWRGTLAMPMGAQSMVDDTPFGGSRVFSEGLNPLGNSARFDRIPRGWYLAFEEGDQKTRDAQKTADALAQGIRGNDASGISSALLQLDRAPWAIRRRGFGLSYGDEHGLHFSIGRETLHGTQATVDTYPKRLGSSVALTSNQSFVDAWSVEKNRLVLGVGNGDASNALGVALRLEQVRMGQQRAALNPSFGLIPLRNLEDLLDDGRTDRNTWALTLDSGFTKELIPHLRVGLMVDRLIPRHFWDIHEQTQARLGFQLDLGNAVQVTLEGDLNQAARLPLPEKQRMLAVSLHVTARPVISFGVGGERRTIGGFSTTRVGFTLRFRTAPLDVGLGFQFGQDRPLIPSCVQKCRNEVPAIKGAPDANLGPWPICALSLYVLC